MGRAVSVRKRTWLTAAGEQREAYVVDYVDQGGKRHLRTFDKQKPAKAYAATVAIEVRHGIHTADNDSITVTDAGELWLKTADRNELERTTVDQYRQHLEFHIKPFLGSVKLSRLTAPQVRDFEDKLLHGSPAPSAPSDAARVRTRTMARKVIGSLGAILADAQERGLVGRNVVRELRSKRRRGRERRADARQQGKLKVGLDIPSPTEIKAIIRASSDRWRPFLLTAIFTGLRASELRGLRWSDIDFDRGELHVRQRADRYHKIGPPKSVAGERTVPIPPGVLQLLSEWKLACPKGKFGLAFPNGAGKVEFHVNIINRMLIPTQIAAGVSEIVKDDLGKVVLEESGEPVRKAKYTGLHALRHFYASWCINRKIDGGLELPAKVVQERLGHSSITVTLDTYGHLFPRGDDRHELATAEIALLA
jgi:integrase